MKHICIIPHPGPQPAKISGGRSHFWQRLWRHRCSVNHDATFLPWSACQERWGNLFHSGGHGCPQRGKMGICPTGNWHTNQICLVNLKLIELILAITVYFPVWHSHCTRAKFTVLVSCHDELLTFHSCPAYISFMQRQVPKLVNGLFYYWPLLRNNNMATNLQGCTSNCSNRSL